jgi:hypothetical protein
MSKEKSKITTWGHHETMIVNLRDWVSREINLLRDDVSKKVPTLEDDPHIESILNSAHDMNIRLFDLIRSVVDRAEAEEKKSAKKKDDK